MAFWNAAIASPVRSRFARIMPMPTYARGARRSIRSTSRSSTSASSSRLAFVDIRDRLDGPAQHGVPAGLGAVHLVGDRAG